MRILSIFVNSMFEYFEIFLRTEVVSVEDDIRLVLDEYNSSLRTDEFERIIYTFKDFPKLFLTFFN